MPIGVPIWIASDVYPYSRLIELRSRMCAVSCTACDDGLYADKYSLQLASLLCDAGLGAWRDDTRTKQTAGQQY